jgi:hypothetical protein
MSIHFSKSGKLSDSIVQVVFSTYTAYTISLFRDCINFSKSGKLSDSIVQVLYHWRASDGRASGNEQSYKLLVCLSRIRGGLMDKVREGNR